MQAATPVWSICNHPLRRRRMPERRRFQAKNLNLYHQDGLSYGSIPALLSRCDRHHGG